MEQPAKPIAFKVRTQGRYNGKKGGAIKSGGGGAGALWYFDKTFHPATMNTPTPASTKPFRYLSVCSGMEAASVAWHPLGWTPAGFSEIEPFPCAILAHRFPNTPNHGSLTEYQSWPIEPGSIDLLVGGTPCQSFSVAGLRKGLADPRGNLALTFLGLADKLKPRWIVWENVPGVLSSGGGRDFGSFLGALRELGYGFAYRVLDAQHFGVPQRRRRVFVVAHLGDWRPAAEVLFEPDCVRRDTKKGKQAGQGAAARAQGGVGADCGRPFTASSFAQYADGVGTVRASGGDLGGGSETLLTHPVTFQPDNLRRDAGADPSTEATTTLKASAGDQMPHVATPPPAIPIHDQATRHAGKRGDNQDGKGNGLGIGKPGDPMNTLTRGDHHAVYSPPMAVRRLTPVECERLQGFPDNWSRIPWKGKPAEDCPDGPRYKACGNSMAVPVMAWIGRNIVNHEAKQAR